MKVIIPQKRANKMKAVKNRKIFIFTVLASLIIAIADVIVFIFIQKPDPTGGFNAEVLSGFARYVMVLLPVVLSFVITGQRSDPERYVKNFLYGICSIAIILFINLISMMLIVKVVYPEAVTVPAAYIYSFFSMLAGFSAVYSASLIAASLFDNVVKRLTLLFLVLFLPTLLVLIFQFPVYEYLTMFSSADGGTVTINAAASGGLFTFPSFYTFSGTNLSVSQIFSGPTGLTNINNIVYNYILGILFFLVGFFISNKRLKFDTYPLCTDILCVLAFFPVMFAAVIASGETFLTIIAAVSMYAVIIFFRGRAGRLLRSTVTFVICSGLVLITCFSLASVRKNNVAFVKYSVSDISKIVAHVPSPRLICTDNRLTGFYEIPITEKNVISAVLCTDFCYDDSQRGNMPYDCLKVTLYTFDGKEYDAFFDLTQDAARTLYAYIDSSPALVEMLEQPLHSPAVAACLQNNAGDISMFSVDSIPSSVFGVNESSFDLLMQTEKLDNEVSPNITRYYYGHESYLDQNYETSVVAVYRYINGGYYIEYFPYPAEGGND